MSDITGTLFAIKRYAIHDGPNIRTTVFLKGCPLSCWWCHNPEGIPGDIQLLRNPEICIECGECIDDCPHQALEKRDEHIHRDDEKCQLCQGCVDTCPALAHEAIGWSSDVGSVLEQILKDKPFYDETQGGVTFSGGEPLLQPDFLMALLIACGEVGIHRSVDSSAHASTETLLRINQETDLWLLDLKHMNSERLKEHTGVGNQLILRNIQKLSELGADMRIRIPLIPGFNDMQEDLEAMVEFISNLKNPVPVDILKYHDSALSKYRKLGMDYAPVESHASGLSPEQAIYMIRDSGLEAQLGG